MPVTDGPGRFWQATMRGHSGHEEDSFSVRLGLRIHHRNGCGDGRCAHGSSDGRQRRDGYRVSGTSVSMRRNELLTRRQGVLGVLVMLEPKRSQFWDFLAGIAVIGSAARRIGQAVPSIGSKSKTQKHPIVK
jgi:hypothetical protein